MRARTEERGAVTGAPGRLETAIDQAQDFPKQVPRHDNLGQMEHDIAIMR